MAILTPSIYINDNEVDLKLICVYSNKNKKSRKYTISAAERSGLIKSESGSFLLGNHPRKFCQKLIYFAWNDQLSEGAIDNISRGGVSIVTKDNLTIGQTIKFVIPGTKYDKGVMLKGKVTHTSPKGVGAKIIGILKKKENSLT